jgi:hypothetical protein
MIYSVSDVKRPGHRDKENEYVQPFRAGGIEFFAKETRGVTYKKSK